MDNNRLKDLREDNDLPQKNVASFLEITQQQYSLYETNMRLMPINLLIKLARFYNVTLDYLTGITNIKNKFPTDK